MQQISSQIRIILVEDHAIFIEGLCSILQTVAGINICGTFTSGSTALTFLKENPVDVVFLDISLPEISGIEVCKSIKAIDENIKIIALTNHSEKSVIMEMLQNGSDGYLLKNTSKQDLINAIFQVLNNQFLMNSELQKILFSSEAKKTDIPRLTKRELEILRLVSEGGTTASIAKNLFISPQTVETHRHNVMQKLNVSNAASLIKKAGELGLLSEKF